MSQVLRPAGIVRSKLERAPRGGSMSRRRRIGAPAIVGRLAPPLPLPHWVAGATSLGVLYPGDIKSEVSALAFLAFDAGRGHRLLRLVRSGATHGGMPLGAFVFDALGVLDDAVEVVGLMLATGT